MAQLSPALAALMRANSCRRARDLALPAKRCVPRTGIASIRIGPARHKRADP
jgi:hypothetical protein